MNMLALYPVHSCLLHTLTLLVIVNKKRKVNVQARHVRP